MSPVIPHDRRPQVVEVFSGGGVIPMEQYQDALERADMVVDLIEEPLLERIEELEAGIQEVVDLIYESNGAYGLHQNGDPAPWQDLMEGGKYEEWLTAFCNVVVWNKRDQLEATDSGEDE